MHALALCPATLSRLFSALSKVGVKRAAASVLFLRLSVLESLKRNVHNEEVLPKLLAFYKDARRLAIHAERSSVIALRRDGEDGYNNESMVSTICGL